jgi:phage gpG-like protein
MADLVDIRLDVDELVARLNRMEAASMNLPMDAFATITLGYVEEMFQTQGAVGTQGEWDPLLLSTLQRHPRRVGGMILQDTGAMANVQVMDVQEQSFVVKSPKDYARWHIRGTRHMARRDFFALNFTDLLNEMSDFVFEEIRK